MVAPSWLFQLTTSAVAESPVADLRGEVGEFARREMIDRRDVEFGHV